MKPNFKCERSINYDLLYNQLESLRERIRNTPFRTDEQIESLKPLINQEKTIVHKMVQLINYEINDVKSSTILLQPHKVEDINKLLFQHTTEIKALEECKLELLSSIFENSQFLGSCQYKSIEDYYFMCKSLYEQIELYNNPSTKENNLNFLFKLLGFATINLRYDTEEEYLNRIRGIVDEYLEDNYIFNDGSIPFLPIESIIKFYKFCRNESWDLRMVAEPPFNMFGNHQVLPNTYYDLEQISLTILCCQVLYGTDPSMFADFDT